MALTITGLTVRTQVGTGTWIDYGGGGGSTTSTDVFVSSTSSRARKVSNGIKGFALDLGVAGVNLSNSVVGVRWATLAGVGALNTRANGGVVIRLQDAAGNQSNWNVAGNDTYGGGWEFSVISTSTTPSTTSGVAATLTSIRYVGIVWDETGAVGGGDPNCYIDEILTWGNSGLTVSGNTTALVSDLQTWDNTSKYGIVDTRSGITYSKANLILAPDASKIITTGETLVLEDPSYFRSANIHSSLSTIGITSTDSDVIDMNRFTLRAATNPEITGTAVNRIINFSSATNVDVDLATFYGFDGATTPVRLGNSSNTYNDVSFEQCGQVQDTGAVIRDCIFRNTTNADGAYRWTTNTNLQDCRFASDGTGHGIDISSAPTDPSPTNFIGIVGVGYGANDTADATVDNNTGHDVYIAASGGTSGITVNTTSNTTFANTVVAKFTVIDSDTQAAIQNARVFVEADTGGDLPSDDSVTISAVASVATVSHTAHGYPLASSQKVIIRGASQDAYNGVKTVTVSTANTYTYTMGSSPSSPATGTITATALILDELTSASGVAQNTAFDYTTDQPIRGKARKGSASTYYKSTPIVGTITSNGLDQTVVAVADE